MKEETKRTQERLARSGRIREHFTDWILDDDNEVETHVIHSALKNFKEVLDELPPEIKKGKFKSRFLCDVSPSTNSKYSSKL